MVRNTCVWHFLAIYIYSFVSIAVHYIHKQNVQHVCVVPNSMRRDIVLRFLFFLSLNRTINKRSYYIFHISISQSWAHEAWWHVGVMRYLILDHRNCLCSISERYDDRFVFKCYNITETFIFRYNFQLPVSIWLFILCVACFLSSIHFEFW